MNEIQTAIVPKYYIEYYDPKTKHLIDISENGYDTIELCEAEIATEKIQDQELIKHLLELYEEDLKNFVLDLDSSDREPLNPLKLTWHYDMKPGFYVFGEDGHVPAIKRAIENLDSLLATPEQIETVNSILSGSLDPETFKSVESWIGQCFNKPFSDEIKLRAINEVLEGYGIEAVHTSKWKNGYWCSVLCSYVNMCDLYIPTVIHHRKHGFMVASIGDVMEKNKHVI